MERRFSFGKAAALLALLGLAATDIRSNALRLISVEDSIQHPSASASGDSFLPIMSADGRFVLFASTANNLALTESSNAIPVLISPRQNVFLRDRQNRTTTLVSVAPPGPTDANENAEPTGLSNDGRYALFESSASNLVLGVTNGLNHVFMRDLANRVTRLVSVARDGSEGDGPSRSSSMTPDGRFVAFASEADNLVSGDTNGIPDVFVRDLQSAVTLLASVGAVSTNATAAVGGSESPVMTPDGRYVAFYSTATNLVATNTLGGNIYVRDLVGLQTTLVSAQAQTVLTSVIWYLATAISHSQTISDDGRYVAYVVSPLPPARFNPSISPASGIVLRHDLQTGLEDLIGTNCNVPGGAYQDLRILDMTPDGRFVAFVANTNGIAGDTTCIFVWNASTRASTLASGDQSNSVPVRSICQWPVLDPSGSVVAFFSSATNLTTNGAGGDLHLYVRDLLGQTTSMVDVDTNGAGSEMNPVTIARLSDGGRLIAFECPGSGLVANDRNRSYDVFVRDLASNTVDLVSVADPALISMAPNANSGIGGSSISADGRYVAFESDADNLVNNDTNGCRDVFVRDLVTGSNFLVSVDIFGLGSGNGVSYEPSISADGRYVLFTSSATNLVTGDINGAPDVFVRDLQAGVTFLASTNLSAAGSPILLPSADSISTNGSHAFFHTQRSLYSRDLQTGALNLLTPSGLTSFAISSDGGSAVYINTPDASTGSVVIWSSQVGAPLYTNVSLGAVSVLGITPDANTIIYSTISNQIFAADHAANTNWMIGSGFSGAHGGFHFTADGWYLAFAASPTPGGTNQVYLYDLRSRAGLLVSRSLGSSAPASGNSDSPTISPDGRFVAFRSDASDIVPNDTNTVPDVFLYDRLTQATAVVTSSQDSSRPANNRSLSPVFSGDGLTLLVQSLASDLVSQDFNQAEDVFAYTLFYAGISPVPAPGPGVWLTWPVVPGQTYRVQYKENLQDTAWVNATGTITNMGTKAYFSDSSASPVQKFYRISGF
jgi:Tol biopolymer transport system component